MPAKDRTSVDIVIQGSGTKATGALGALISLYEQGYYFERISGTSSGAVVAALVAAYQTVGRDLGDLEKVLRSLDFSKFEKSSSRLADLAGVLGDGWELLVKGGAYTVDYLYDWLTPLLEEVGITHFRDLKVDDPGSSLPVEQRYSVVVHASDISRHTAVRLPWDYHEYGLVADDQSIVDACAASMAFPFIFQPLDIETGTGEKVTWIDGGLMANYPLTVFDRMDGLPSRWPTVGISLFGAPTANDNVVHGIPQILMNMLLTGFEWNRYGLNQEGPTQRSILVDASAVDNITDELNFNVSDDQKSVLFQKGKDAAAAFMARNAPGARV